MTRELALVVRGAVLAALLGCPACQFEVRVEPCSLSCESHAACPGGHRCKAGFCARPQDMPVCTDAGSAGVVGGEPGAPDAAAGRDLPAPQRVEQLAAGSDHNCALFDNGAIRCWGSVGVPPCGALGLGDRVHVGDDEHPSSVGYVQVGGRVTALELGSCFSCALLSQGRVRCWGENDRGQLGYGHTRTMRDDELPESAGDVPLGGRVVELAAGTAHVCARMQGGQVVCWGHGQFGQLGYAAVDNVGDDEPPSEAGFVPLGGAVLQLAAGHQHTCALLEGGAVRCWGQNARGSLGLGHKQTIGDDETPETQPPVALGRSALRICAGGNKSCALLDDETVRCWGRGADGRLGLGVDFGATDLGDDELPTAFPPIDLGGPALEIACGGEHSCALLKDGTLRCFGRNAEGELGYGYTRTIGDDEPPARAGPVPLSGAVLAVSLGRQHSCALVDATDTPRVACWGLNTEGQLGYSDMLFIGDDEEPAERGFISLF